MSPVVESQRTLTSFGVGCIQRRFGRLIATILVAAYSLISQPLLVSNVSATVSFASVHTTTDNFGPFTT